MLPQKPVNAIVYNKHEMKKVLVHFLFLRGEYLSNPFYFLSPCYLTLPYYYYAQSISPLSSLGINVGMSYPGWESHLWLLCWPQHSTFPFFPFTLIHSFYFKLLSKEFVPSIIYITYGINTHPRIHHPFILVFT